MSLEGYDPRDQRVERPFSRDRLINLPSKLGGRAAMATITALQQHHPEAQVVGLCAAFLMLCEHVHANPSDVFQVTSNVILKGEEGRIEFAAVREYLRGEVASANAV